MVNLTCQTASDAAAFQPFKIGQQSAVDMGIGEYETTVGCGGFWLPRYKYCHPYRGTVYRNARAALACALHGIPQERGVQAS